MSRSAESVRPSLPVLAALAGFAAAAVMALLASGFAGDDEIGHFLVARRALSDPELFLSVTGRPLVTLVLAIPSLFGLVGARLAAALAVAVTAYAVVRSARPFPGPGSLWAGFFLVVQPFYLAHAGTAMTEPWAALLVALLILGHVENRTPLITAAGALLPLARLELVILWPLVALVLIRRKEALHLLWLAVPISAWALLGALASGDPLWLLHQAEWGAYEERTWWHYLGGYVWVVGLGLFVPVLTGLAAALRPAGDTPVRVVRSAALVFLSALLVYTFFAWWRPVTFGNLRYLAIVAPAVALLAMEGVRLAGRADRRAWVGTGAAALGALLLWNRPWFRDHTMLERTDFVPLIAALSWIPVLALARLRPWPAPVFVMLLALGGLARNHTGTLHLEPAPEQAAVRRLADAPFLPRDGRPVATNHVLLQYMLGAGRDSRARFPSITGETAARAPLGTVYVWDSHYAPHTHPDSLLGDPAWKFLGGVVSTDSAWVGGVFVRTEPEAVERTTEQDRWLFAARMTLAGLPRVREMALADPGSVTAQRVLAARLFLAGRSTEGSAAFARADAMAPGNPENDALRAELMLRSGRVSEAEAAIGRALAGRPRDGNILALASQIAATAGRSAEARAWLLEAARRLPNNWEIQYGAGAALMASNELGKAEKHMERVVRLNPKHVNAGIALADIAYRNRRMNRVEERLEALIRRRPDCVEAHLSLGEVLLEMGRKDDALKAWRRGLADTGGDSTLARRLAEVGR